MEELQKVHEELDEIIQSGADKIVYSVLTEGSYQKVCGITESEVRAGQFENQVGVAFLSGYGEGVYEVYATYKDDRISKVEIIMIPED